MEPILLTFCMPSLLPNYPNRDACWFSMGFESRPRLLSVEWVNVFIPLRVEWVNVYSSLVIVDLLPAWNMLFTTCPSLKLL